MGDVTTESIRVGLIVAVALAFFFILRQKKR
jgi:hypothetical protein